MTADRAAKASTEELVERFLARYSERTRQAYATDLEDFARFVPGRGQRRSRSCSPAASRGAAWRSTSRSSCAGAAWRRRRSDDD